MIDFQNAGYFKLSQIDIGQISGQIDPLLVDGEQIVIAYKGLRDFVVFTSKRIIAVNVQGITGKKTDYTSLPLSKIQAWSVETAGTFDLDAELANLNVILTVARLTQLALDDRSQFVCQEGGKLVLAASAFVA